MSEADGQNRAAALLAECRELMANQRYAEALERGRALLTIDDQHYNMDLHKLMALLYGLCNQHQQAAQHYMLLCQFDPGYELHHCMQVARGYAEKGMMEEAAILAHAGAAKLNAVGLKEVAADYYESAGMAEQAAKLRR